MKHNRKLFAESLVKIHPNTKILLFNHIQDQQENLDKSNKLHNTLTLQNLSENERHLFLFNKNKHKIADLIQKPHRLNLTFKFLSKDERKLLFEEKKDDIINLIKTSYDLKLIFEFLTKSQRKLLFKQKKDDIVNLIKTSYDLYFILRFLPKRK